MYIIYINNYKRVQRALDRSPEKYVKKVKVEPLFTPEAQFENKGELNVNNFCTPSPRKFF
jgi:predicted GH43/DUF377 family glycosyl hydrolase